ncbi:hypothetical protein [Bradyrhizobium sp.]
MSGDFEGSSGARDDAADSYSDQPGSFAASITSIVREIQPTRRGVLVGGASLALAGSARADDYPSVEVKYEDSSRRALLVVYSRMKGDVPETRQLRLAVAAFGDPEKAGISNAARFVRMRTATGWLAYVANASFPGGPAFRLEVEIVWDSTASAAARAKSSSLIFRLIGGFGDPPIQISTDAKGAGDLEHFLFDQAAASGNDPDAGIELIGKLTSKVAPLFMSSLFGDTLSVANAKDVRLCFNRNGHWRLKAQIGAFAALPGEGLDVSCDNIIFGVLTDQTGSRKDNQTGYEENKTSSAFDVSDVDGKNKQDVRNLFEGPGAPPGPKTPEAGAANPTSPRALYGLAKLTKFSGALSFGGVPGRKPGDPATAKISISPDSVEERTNFVAWRNLGDGRPVLALRAEVAVTVERTEQGAKPSKFPASRGAIWRMQGDDKVVRFAGSLEPLREFQIVTRFGPFLIAPLPGMSERPTVRAAIPSIRIAAAGAKPVGRLVTQFAAPFALKHAAVALDRADSASKETFTSLDFDEAECLFRLDGVPLRHSWTGRSMPSSDPPQAEAIIQLGALPLEGPGARLSLNRARLTLRRPRDLLALNYRFQDLVLERDGAEWDEARRAAKDGIPMPRWWVVPDRRLAAFSGYRPTLPPPAVPPLCDDPQPSATSATHYDVARDPRPLMVVEFPPQHIAEQTFFRQFRVAPSLPDTQPGISDEDAEKLRGWDPADLGAGAPETAQKRVARLKEALDERAKLRRRICTRKINMEVPAEYVGSDDDQLAVWHKVLSDNIIDDNKAYSAFADFYRVYPFTAFAVAFARFAEKEKLPIDQTVYIGPAYLDPVASRIARRIASRIDDLNARVQPDSGVERQYQLRALPEVELLPGEISDLQSQLGFVKPFPNPEDWTDNTASVKNGDGKLVDSRVISEFLEKREKLKTQRNYDYAAFYEFYNRSLDERLKYQPAPEKQGDMKAGAPRPKFYIGRHSYTKFIDQLPPAQRLPAFKDIAANIDAYNHLVVELNKDVEAFKIPAEARASGPSRLAFRIPADDYEGGRPKTESRLPGAFPFTADALTNWGSFDLAVVRRAQKVFNPLSGGRDARRWDRNETRDEAEKLAHQGLTQGGLWARREREGRIGAKDGCLVPQLKEPEASRMTGAQRMAEIAAESREAPRWDETSIEIPFRLMLSPAQDALWRTPLNISEIRDITPPADRPVPLWFARLEEPVPSLRAIWSPDYRPEALLDPELDPEVGSPPRGPWAPWALPRNKTSRQGYSEDERNTVERFRAPLDAYDRHELVMLSSLHGLPVRGRRAEDGSLVGNSQINPPSGFELRDVVREKLKDSEEPADWSAIYKPQAIGTTELTLTALGGTFEADTNFIPPASARMKGRLPDAVRAFYNAKEFKIPDVTRSLFDALSIERWRQSTILGRDIKVEVVYRGFLFPLGHRASLVKLTERRFMAMTAGGPPVAFLVQRMFLRIGLPDKKYPAIRQPNRGRRWPAEKLKILTIETPDLVDPTDALDPGPGKLAPTRNGRLFLREEGSPSTRPGLVFWPRVVPRDGGEVRFEMQIDGRSARVRLPLIFVDNTAANDAGAMKRLVKYYNELNDGAGPDPLRVMNHSGFKRRYAAESEPDGTSFETLSWVLEAEGSESVPPATSDRTNITFTNDLFDFSALHQGADQPPFYPAMQEGEVRISQLDRLLGGTTKPVRVRFDPEYLAFGFPPDEQLSNPNGNKDTAWTDVYLDFLSKVGLDPREAGDRVGGAARPNADLIALSRSRGPVGGAIVPQPPPAAGAPPKPNSIVAASAQLHKPDIGSFFNLDAKILGILTFGEALKFIGAGIASTPAFKEVTQYASALLTQGRDREKALEKDSGAIIAKVRDALLVPLRDALTLLAKEWNAVGAAASAKFDEGEAIKRLTALYPDVGRAYTDLQRALDDTIKASTSVRDIDDLLKHFAAIYAAGRRFILSIERVAADPIAPVRAALRELFQSKVAKLLGDLGTVQASVRDGLAALELAAKDKIKSFVTAQGLTVWRRVIFSLPVARPGSQANKVREAVEKALVATLGDDVWLNSLTSGARADEALTSAAQVIERSVRVRLADTVNDAIKTEIEEALEDWDITSDADKRIRGLLFSSVLTALRDINGAVVALTKESATIEIRAVREKLESVLQNTVDLARPALENLQLPAHDLCQHAVVVLRNTLSSAALRSSAPITTPAKLVGSLTTAINSLTALRDAIEDYRAKAAAATASSELGGELATLKGRVDKLLQKAAEARDQANKAAAALDRVSQEFERLVQTALSDKVCKKLDPQDLAGLPIETLSALSNVRAVLIGALVKVADAVKDAGELFGGFGDILTKLKATDDDIETGRAMAAVTNIATTAATVLAPVLGPPTDPLKALRIYSVRATRTAVKAIADLSMTVSQLVQEATSLKSSEEAVKDLKTAVTAFVDDMKRVKADDAANALKEAIDNLEKQRTGYIKQIDTTVANAKKIVQDADDHLKESIKDLQTGATSALETLKGIGRDLVEAAELRLIYEASRRLSAGEETAKAIINSALGIVRPAIGGLYLLQLEIVKNRETILAQLPEDNAGGAAGGNVDDILKNIAKATAADLRRLLLVPRPAAARPLWAAEQREPNTAPQDYLTAEREQLRTLSEKDPNSYSTQDFTDLAALFTDWREGRSSAELLVDRLKRAAELILSGDLARVVDLEGARRRIEAKLKEMIPSKISLGYDFSVEMKNVGKLFLPKGDKLLTIAAAASYDLLDASNPPVFTALATLSPFDVDLFDVVTLMFDGARFSNDSRKGSDFKLAYRDFKLGSKAEFIKPLESILNPKGSGPYVRPLRGSPGIEAGYSLDIGIVSIGTLSFANVSLNAACRLPFDNRQAIFSVSIGRRDKPFLISALPYTGGGFLGLLANSKKIIGFEASFEFGGGGAFKFGLLEGQGRICLGIYVNQVDDPGGEQGTTIEGFFYAGGEAHVSCFSVSATLVVRIAQQAGGSMHGSAVFTFSFSLGFTDITFKIGVEKNEGKGFSGSGSANLLGQDFTRFAALGSPGSIPLRFLPGAWITSEAVSQSVDWNRYQSYFTDDIDGFAS